MTFIIEVTGRRISDGQGYRLAFDMDATSENAVKEHIETNFDWDDAATKEVKILNTSPSA